MNYEIVVYETANGKLPFEDWLNGLDVTQVAIILRRIDRFKKGIFGDHEPLGEGVYEARIHEGPGYRIYYSKIGNNIIILLSGGIKRTQDKDINKAKEYLENYKLRKKKKYGQKMG